MGVREASVKRLERRRMKDKIAEIEREAWFV